jgi:hypothetical protein
LTLDELHQMSSLMKERMAHLSLRGFCPILDLGEQVGLDPNAFVRNALGEGLRLPDLKS